MPNKIAPEPRLNDHQAALIWVNQLLMDVRLMIEGLPTDKPVTHERLNEWHDVHKKDIQRCQHVGRVRR